MRVAEIATLPDTLRVTITYPKLSTAEVFERWSDPELLCRWWPQMAELDFREGGQYLLAWPAMGWRLRGEYLAIIPDHAIRFTWTWDHEAAPLRMVSIRLEPHDEGGTRLELEHGPYAETPDEQETRAASHLAGWRHFLPRLDTL